MVHERSACGVGFVVSRQGIKSHAILNQALEALCSVEHRGGCLADGRTGDGAGVMAEVPFELLGYPRGEVAVAQLFFMLNADRRRLALEILESTFRFLGLEVVGYRDVPTDTSILGRQARDTLPAIVQAFVKRPAFCRTEASFNALLYRAKQTTRTQLRSSGMVRGVFFVSLSTTTIVYKALVRSQALATFYPDLRDPRFTTRFALFHRRFSTNTRTSWDKAQPFRMIAHNGEINTIEANRSWSYAREQALGLRPDELLTHQDISDSGSLNEMVEALRYRSSIPQLSEILAIMVPPAHSKSVPFYKFWSRALEPWDGPAFLAYSDGEVVGARLDRNGFRPCRWAMTSDTFYLASEAGAFSLNESTILEKGLLTGGMGTQVVLSTGEVRFEDPASARENAGASFDPRLETLGRVPVGAPPLVDRALFRINEEEIESVLRPMIATGKEPIGSMGDTARIAVLSDQPRSFFDFFYQGFAQVTNPPLDHLRERSITELETYLGARPNVFAPKTLIPLQPAIELASPILDLEEMAWLRQADDRARHGHAFEAVELGLQFPRSGGPRALEEALEALGRQAVEATRRAGVILVLSDRGADHESPPIPSLLGLRAVVEALDRGGLRLDASIVVDTADARTTHQVSALIGFGAAAVCPYFSFALAGQPSKLKSAYEEGLLKVMSKVGISCVRSYQGSQLFTPLGLGPGVVERYFRGQQSAIGGLEIDDLGRRILAETDRPLDLGSTHLFREHPKALRGEKHSMTSALSRSVHELLEATTSPLSRWDLYETYLASAGASQPISPRHLLEIQPSARPIALEDVEPRQEIMRRFGAGSISFGAVSAEAQRDVIVAMRAVGGRSGSGEGGENPYYYSQGITATSKQVASARFGVTAEFLISGEEIEIKVAQGAKPGEGGQLMGVKVDADIARARHALPGADLISPPPLHDIYSIEDLRELIYELKQLKPGVAVSVKLVAGAGIGAIAAGVVKAGADIVHVSGGDGGTGAASLSSMKHAGLPWEIGLVDVHQTLLEQQLRGHVTLRVDGGLQSGRDVVMATLLGAEEVAFGKLLLVAEGCIMARVCEKNTCPRGIATHDPRFKAKYRGTSRGIVALLEYVAEDVRRTLAKLGVSRLDEIIGRADLLMVAAEHEALVAAKRLDLSRFLVARPHQPGYQRPLLVEPTSRLNARLLEDALPALEQGQAVELKQPIKSTDRAVLSTLAGAIAHRAHQQRLGQIARGEVYAGAEPRGAINIELIGSAGGGFAAFCVEGLEVLLRGEANDSVAKSMSGGRVVIRPAEGVSYSPETNAIIGNCALYGATGGVLFVRGRAGDRFAVRNSGAVSVVEGTGLHACEYMTKGTVVILGSIGQNAGAGMTGGALYLPRDQIALTNREYVEPSELTAADQGELRGILEAYFAATASTTAEALLAAWDQAHRTFVRLSPRARQLPDQQREHDREPVTAAI